MLGNHEDIMEVSGLVTDGSYSKEPVLNMFTSPILSFPLPLVGGGLKGRLKCLIIIIKCMP